MKKNMIYMAALAVMTAACSNEDDTFVTSPENNNVPSEVKMITETITATNGDGATRAAVDAEAKFTWSADDQIAVHVDDGKYYTATIASGEDTNEASFSVSHLENLTRDAFAIYPASIVATDATNYGQSGSALDVILPSSYTLDQVSGTTTPCPMIAENTGESWEFYQLCGLLRLTVSEIPADATYLQVDFGGYQVCGDFSIASPVVISTSPELSVPTISTSAITGTSPANAGDKISITDLGDNTSVTVNIPLPIGTYNGITVSAWNNNNVKVKDLTFNYTAKRAKGKRASIELPENSKSILPGSVITTSSSNIADLESIIKFTFKNGDETVSNIRFVRFFSGNNKLMASYNEGTSVDTPNPVTVSQSTDFPEDFYVGLRFDATANDPIIFQLFDKDGKAYSGSMNAPDDGFETGKIYNETVDVHLDEFTANASGKKVCFSPGDYGANNTFSAPFEGIGNTSYYFNHSNCIANHTVAGVEWRIPEDGVGDYEMWYIIGGSKGSRTMTGNASLYYKVYIDKSVTINSVTTDPTCCLLLPPDGAVLTDAEKTELSNAASSSKPLSDYLKYIGKGFVLLTRTSHYDSGWKTAAYPTMGVYRVRQSGRAFKFDININPTEASNNPITSSKTSVLTRVRYIHTTYTPPTE